MFSGEGRRTQLLWRHVGLIQSGPWSLIRVARALSRPVAAECKLSTGVVINGAYAGRAGRLASATRFRWRKGSCTGVRAQPEPASRAIGLRKTPRSGLTAGPSTVSMRRRTTHAQVDRSNSSLFSCFVRGVTVIPGAAVGAALHMAWCFRTRCIGLAGLCIEISF